jgi:RNA polymerase sigma factor (TIGR02999 family)
MDTSAKISDEDLRVVLDTIRNGNDRDFRRLLPLVYDELHRRARGLMGAEREDHTLQATALVHEAYLKLIEFAGRWVDEAHFFRTAAEIMRHILVDHARARASSKRGGALRRMELSESIAESDADPPDLIDIDDALKKLKVEDPRRAEVVTLKYFGGLGEKEIAKLLGLTERTVRRDWVAARLWLHQQIRDANPE